MSRRSEEFEKDLKEFNIVLSEHQIEQFFSYYEMLIEKNKVMNLTAITDLDEVIKKHFVDSLSLIKAYDLTSPVSLIDIGTGAGFPGIPLKIVFPDLEITLLDSLNKRVDFLQSVIASLGLKKIDAFHGRAEDFARQEKYREKFDLCVSRAVANLSTLCEYCLPYVKTGGKFISYKSDKITEELKTAEHAVNVLGGKVKEQISFTLPDSDINRNLIVIEKHSKTPKQYPRKAGTASKSPL